MQKISKSEVLVDSIMVLNNYSKPDSLAYTLRNPLLLKSHSAAGKHDVNEDGIRIFNSTLGAYKAAVFDVEKKLDGTSNSGIKTTDCLRNLLAVYNINKEQDIMSICYFLRKALGDPTISPLTPLSYFKEN